MEESPAEEMEVQESRTTSSQEGCSIPPATPGKQPQ